MKVVRKSLWRSANGKTARHRANQRAAKERLRLARVQAAAAPPPPDLSRAPRIRALPPLFTISIRCRDGARVRLSIRDLPWGLHPSPTAAARKISAVLTHYRPA